ncbi:MAG TPA: DUF202 domain-containing protein [Bryobacteraceae bacterium]|nr:DUF202 domain-containing protein [Bryobacteraceae bacterium]
MESATLRDYLAAERTLLAWIRTGLALMGFGFVVARFGLFLREVNVVVASAAVAPGLSVWFGTALVLLGVAVNAGGAWRYMRIARRIERGEAAHPVSHLGIALAAALAVMGIAMAAYLIVVR